MSYLPDFRIHEQRLPCRLGRPTRAATSARTRPVTRSKIAAGLALWAMLPIAQAVTAPSKSLADLSLEELANIEVTSVSRRPERVSDAPASVFVITAEDIRRSGATTLPEALRLAPNLQVAQLDAGQYAISARGFNNAISNKLLVLIDGRTVYAPFYSSVQWDRQDVMLENVDRIEVISGPGGILWGTNAVNGVINVVTRSAAQTQGALAVVNAGDREAGGAFRYGGSLDSGGYFRVYAKALQLQNTQTAAGVSQPDGWDRTQAGFRADWANASEGFVLLGNVFYAKSEDRGFIGPFALGALQVSETNLLGQWTRRFANGSDIRAQAYYDYSNRDDGVFYQPRKTSWTSSFSMAFLWEYTGFYGVRAIVDPMTTFGRASSSASSRPPAP